MNHMKLQLYQNILAYMFKTYSSDYDLFDYDDCHLVVLTNFYVALCLNLSSNISCIKD